MFDKAATEFKSHSQPRVVAVQQTGSPVYGEPRSPTQPSYYVTIKGIGFVSITDANGNTNTPIDGTFALKVPNVSYDLLGEKAVLISTPVNQTYTMTFQVGTSPVMVEVIKGLNNVTPTEVIRYRDKTLPAGTTAQLKITPEGVEDLRYDADGDGEFETTVAPTVKVEGSAASDVTPPVVSVNVTAQQGQAIVTLTVSDANSGVKSVYYSLDGTEFRPYTAPFQVDPAQTSIIYAFADDNLANRSSLVEKTFDFAPPVTTATALPQPVGGEWNTSDVTLTLRASEIAGASGVARITYTATGAQAVPETIVNANTTSLVITAEGVTTVTFFATDNAGNVEAAKTLTVKIAKSSPVISFAERVQGAGRQLTITAADTGAGVQTLEYSLDGAQFLPYTAPLIVDPTRNPTVYVRATGNLLNVVTYKPLMLTTSVTRDAAPREIIVTATIRNDSTAAVTTNFVLNGVKLNNKPTTSALPITINTLAAGESVVKTLRFPASAAKPNTRPTLAGSGTSHGQAFGGSVQIVVP